MGLSNGVLREYNYGDEKSIFKLYRDVLGRDQNTDEWKWQYRDSVNGQAWMSVWEMGNEIIAFYGLLRNNLNFMGRKIISGTPTDTMVRSDFRGKGLYTKLASRVYYNASETGAEAIWGFPNRNSYPGFMRNLEGQKIANLKEYYYRLELPKILGARLNKVVKFFSKIPNRVKYLIIYRYLSKYQNKAIKIIVSSNFPDSLDDVLKEILNYEVLCIWKDLSYLKWRYENHPKNQYVSHILYINKLPLGLIVCREHEKSITICEVLHRKKDTLETVLLIRSVIDYYYNNSNAQRVNFLGHDNGFFDTIFSASGFKEKYSANRVFVGRVFKDKNLEKKFVLPHNWSITCGDTDVI